MNELEKKTVVDRYGWLFVTVIIFLTRVPEIILASPDRLLNDSELEMTLGAMDRFLGVPSAILIWPAGPLHMLAVPLFVIDFIFSSHFALSPTAFVDYMAHMYREPWHALLLVRLTVAILSSLCFASLYKPFARLLGSRTAGFFAAAIPATVPILWSHSCMAVPDTPAFALGCAAIAPLLSEDIQRKHVVMAGTLAGLAVATKVTVIPLLIFILALALQNCRGFRPQAFLLFMLFLGVGFAIGCPYLWTDPVRLIKTVVGNAARPGNALGWMVALRTTAEVIPVWLLVVMIAALAALAKRRQFWLLAGSLAGIVFTISIVARAGVTFPRYLMPLAPVAGVLIVMALIDARAWLSRFALSPRFAQSAVPLILALMTVGNLIVYAVRLPAELNEFRALNDVVSDLKSIDSRSSIIIPYDNFFYYLAGKSSSQSLARMGDNCAMVMANGKKIAEFASKSGLPQSTITALPRVFDAQEQDFVAQMQVMSFPADREGYDLHLWVVDDLAPRFGFMTRQEAVSKFLRGEVDAAIVNKLPDGVTPAKSYADKWFLLMRSPQEAEADSKDGIR